MMATKERERDVYIRAGNNRKNMMGGRKEPRTNQKWYMLKWKQIMLSSEQSSLRDQGFQRTIQLGRKMAQNSIPALCECEMEWLMIGCHEPPNSDENRRQPC